MREIGVERIRRLHSIDLAPVVFNLLSHFQGGIDSHFMHLHGRTKEEHFSRIKGLHGEGNIAMLSSALLEAFEDHHENEDFRAWCAGFAYESECDSAATLQDKFISQHPLSLYPIKADRATLLIQAGKIDLASNEARSYLAVLHEHQMKDAMQQSELIADGVSRAFLLLSAVYTEIAARSYSIRLFNYALGLPLQDYWKERFEQEKAQLAQELESEGLKAADDKWEQFFESGNSGQDLMIACEAKGFPILKKRVELLTEMFQEKPHLELDEEEIFQLIYQTEQGAFVLV